MVPSEGWIQALRSSSQGTTTCELGPENALLRSSTKPDNAPQERKPNYPIPDLRYTITTREVRGEAGMSRFSSKGATLLGLAILTCTSALGSEADVDYRRYSMEAIGGHMQAIVKILRQEVPHSGHLSIHANAIADMARVAPDLFPEGSQGREALPAIWEQPEDFAKRLDAFHSAAEAFKDAAESGDPESIGSAIGGLGQACKGCHDNYREE